MFVWTRCVVKTIRYNRIVGVRDVTRLVAWTLCANVYSINVDSPIVKRASMDAELPRQE